MAYLMIEELMVYTLDLSYSEVSCNELSVTHTPSSFYVHQTEGSGGFSVESVTMWPENDKWDGQKNQIGVLVFKTDNKQRGPEHADLILIDSDKLDYRPTLHADAYRKAYGKGPEKTHNIVATGFSHQTKKGGNEYNSGTFNDGKASLSQSNYATPGRKASQEEKDLIELCLTEWKATGFKKDFIYYKKKK